MHSRGEYLIYQQLIKDGGLCSQFRDLFDMYKDEEETTEGWYNRQIECIDRIDRKIDDIFKVNNKYKIIFTGDSFNKNSTYDDIVFSWKSVFSKDKGVIGSIYVTRNGNTELLISSKGLSNTIITNGIYVFYSVYEDGIASVFKRRINDGLEHEIANIRAENSFTLAGFYDSTLYYIDGITPYHFYKYDINDDIHDEIFDSNLKPVDGIMPVQNNQYIYMVSPTGDAGAPGKIEVYDTDKKNLTVITNNRCLMGDTLEITEEAVFCVEFIEKKDFYFDQIVKIALKKYKVDGSECEVLINNLEVRKVISLTDHEIIYIDKKNEKKIETFN